MTKNRKTVEKFASLVAKLGELTSANEALMKQLDEEHMNAAKGMSATLELVKRKKQIRIIEHIAAGRASEAICELLNPEPLAIDIQVQFADDHTRKAAEREMFDALKKHAISQLEALQIAQEKKA